MTLQANRSRTALRAGAGLLLIGVVAGYVVTQFHPAHEAPNNHHAAFAEYSASENWIAVHLGQFLAGLVLLAGILALLRALRLTGAPPLLVRVGEASTFMTAAVLAVLQGIDGVALKHAVDAMAAAPTAMQATTFADAETVRWIEWAMAGYFRITLGLSLALVGSAVLATRRQPLPRWTGLIALLGGSAYLVDGVDVTYDGFTGASLPSLISTASLAGFTIAVAIVALRRPKGYRRGHAVRADGDQHRLVGLLASSEVDRPIEASNTQ
jgi:hypothetical protein